MEKQSDSEKRFCGNCRYHNTYDYPHHVFCFVKFQRRDNPIVSVFDRCNMWEFKPQECFCLEDALKARKNNNVRDNSSV